MTTILRLAEISEQAYAHNNEISCDGVEIDILHENNNCIVSFRGTSGTKDILTDLRSMRWYDTYTGCMMHKGFLYGARSVWYALYEMIKNDSNIILCGHSKGGAEATVTAALMLEAGLDFKALVTFGSPRVGFGALKRKLQGKRIERIVNGNDFVTQVPSKYLLWRHVSDKIKIGDTADCFSDHSILNYIKELQLTDFGKMVI